MTRRTAKILDTAFRLAASVLRVMVVSSAGLANILLLVWLYDRGTSIGSRSTPLVITMFAALFAFGWWLVAAGAGADETLTKSLDRAIQWRRKVRRIANEQQEDDR